jgi:hypothetical protein
MMLSILQDNMSHRAVGQRKPVFDEIAVEASIKTVEEGNKRDRRCMI